MNLLGNPEIRISGDFPPDILWYFCFLQDRQALENDLERMAREMELLKAQLNKGHSLAAKKSSFDYTGQSEKGWLDQIYENFSHEAFTESLVLSVCFVQVL